VVADAAGNWTCGGLTPLTAPSTVTATSTDPSGNVSEPATTTVIDPTTTSVAPAVEPVDTDDTSITGTGVPGAEIIPMSPLVCDNAPVIVDAAGKWVCDISSGSSLTNGDTVEFTQQEEGKIPSTGATTTVVDPVDSPYVHIGSQVWFDNNDNGSREADESGVSGLIVQLFVAGEDPLTADPIDAVVTNTAGSYILKAYPGDYFVYIPTPPSTAPISSTDVATTAADNKVDDDDNGQQVSSGDPVRSVDINLFQGLEPDATVELGTGGDQDDTQETNGDMTIDFGFVPLASIGDLVWFDLDADGVKDANESGLSGMWFIKSVLMSRQSQRA